MELFWLKLITLNQMTDFFSSLRTSSRPPPRQLHPSANKFPVQPSHDGLSGFSSSRGDQDKPPPLKVLFHRSQHHLPIPESTAVCLSLRQQEGSPTSTITPRQCPTALTHVPDPLMGQSHTSTGVPSGPTTFPVFIVFN